MIDSIIVVMTFAGNTGTDWTWCSRRCQPILPNLARQCGAPKKQENLHIYSLKVFVYKACTVLNSCFDFKSFVQQTKVLSSRRSQRGDGCPSLSQVDTLCQSPHNTVFTLSNGHRWKSLQLGSLVLACSRVLGWYSLPCSTIFPWCGWKGKFQRK